MDATLTSNLFIVIIVTAAISGLITEENISTAPTIEKSSFNTLITQKIFRQCGNSLDSNSICVKLIDDLVQGVISKDEFLNHITHNSINKKMSLAAPSNSL